jgi:hypothetical protein
MIVSKSTAKNGILKLIVVQFLPRTLAGRLTVLGFISGITTAMVPANSKGLPGIITSILFVSAFVAAVRKVRLVRASKMAAGIVIAYFGVRELAESLALIAIGGNGKVSFALYSSAPSSVLGEVDLCLALITALILVWVPQVFFRIQLDINGTKDTQRILLHLITAASTVMTGIILLLLHFGDSRLRAITTTVFIVGVIGVMFLVAPSYRSLAKACWQHGITGVFSLVTWKQHWRNIKNELEEALDRTVKRGMTPPGPP